eukprot:CAMPEP_0184696424 /NCGR_PEP_ID=MMETSP0313-20130426/3725_1 /TAXON_ID=2792 /ORGANISM="Porphyridium aerugineum, Strain SAG 1380-2" /LENGTH=429 /DNA_ID=CAMNT_0027155051 /DNA_START=205 /DNA_END=1494 /DNA_ORIENTATION=-
MFTRKKKDDKDSSTKQLNTAAASSSTSTATGDGSNSSSSSSTPTPNSSHNTSQENNTSDEQPNSKSSNYLETLSTKIFPRKMSKASSKPSYYAIKQVGFAEDPNERFRPSMEDAHIMVERFCGLTNEAFFAIYDGHGGREAVDIVARWLHKYFGEEVGKLRIAVGANPSEEDVAQGIQVLRQPAGMVLGQSQRNIGHTNSSGSPPPESSESLASLPDEADATKEPQQSIPIGDASFVLEPIPVKTVGHAFINAYRRTDTRCFEGKCHYVGSTAVTVYIRHDGTKRTLYAANCGDARAVLCRDGSAVRLSFDHKASTVEEQQRIGESGGFVAAKRVNGVLSISRALGDHAMKNVIIPDPYTSEYDLTDKDHFVIIACDGLWDVMDDEESVRFVSEKFSKGMDMNQISRKLVKSALDRGSMDNISVMVVRL